MLALDRERGQAVLLVSNSGRDADLAGLTMAATAAGTVPPPVDRVEVGWRSALGWSVVGLVLLATAVLRLRAPRSWLTVFDGAAAGAVGLLTLLVHEARSR